MGKLWAVIEVLYQGKQLSNPAAWKKNQVLFTTLGTMVASIITLLPPELKVQFNEIAQADIVQAIAIIGIGVVNVYGTFATTTKIGPKPKSK